MIVLSLFDGIGCGQVALERAGIKVEKYYASEIDKYAIKVTQANYPNTIQLGDIKQIKGENLPKIDLLIGGSPCQGFSFAGKQLNFDDPRSKLFFEYVRLLEECKPTYFLLENVKMKKECQDIISKELGVQPIRINSNLVSAQNRDRLYWTNIPNIEQPKDRWINWGDIRENNVDSEKYYYTEKAIKWLIKHSERKKKTLTIHKPNEKMQMIEASHFKKYSSQRFFGIIDNPINLSSKKVCRLNKKDIPYSFINHTSLPNNDFYLRYITPLECERLQTLNDNYTNLVSDTQRYKMLGNCWTIEVINHIFKNIPR